MKLATKQKMTEIVVEVAMKTMSSSGGDHGGKTILFTIYTLDYLDKHLLDFQVHVATDYHKKRFRSWL